MRETGPEGHYTVKQSAEDLLWDTYISWHGDTEQNTAERMVKVH